MMISRSIPTSTDNGNFFHFLETTQSQTTPKSSCSLNMKALERKQEMEIQTVTELRQDDDCFEESFLKTVCQFVKLFGMKN